MLHHIRSFHLKTLYKIIMYRYNLIVTTFFRSNYKNTNLELLAPLKNGHMTDRHLLPSFSHAGFDTTRANCFQQGSMVLFILVSIGNTEISDGIFESSALAHITG